MVKVKKCGAKCLLCSKKPMRSSYKYCSNICQQEYQYQKYIEKWKLGYVKGLIASGIVSSPIKRYLRNKFNNRCCICGWKEVNIKTGLVPLVADHIDGNWRNNNEDNLRLLCPNCDSLSPTYAALNKGMGRENRVESNRVKNAHILLSKE